MLLLSTEVEQAACEYCEGVFWRDAWDGQYYDEDWNQITPYENETIYDLSIFCCSEDCWKDYADAMETYNREVRWR